MTDIHTNPFSVILGSIISLIFVLLNLFVADWIHSFWKFRSRKVIINVRDPPVMLGVGILQMFTMNMVLVDILACIIRQCTFSQIARFAQLFLGCISTTENLAFLIRMLSYKMTFSTSWRIKYHLLLRKRWKICAFLVLFCCISILFIVTVFSNMDLTKCTLDSLPLYSLILVVILHCALISLEMWVYLTTEWKSDMLSVSMELQAVFIAQFVFFCIGIPAFVVDGLMDHTARVPVALLFFMKTVCIIYYSFYNPTRTNNRRSHPATLNPYHILKVKEKFLRSIQVTKREEGRVMTSNLYHENPARFKEFYEFVTMHYCEELVLFLKETAEWKDNASCSSDRRQFEDFGIIIQKFLEPSSPYEINVSHCMRTDLIEVSWNNFKEMSIAERHDLFKSVIGEIDKVLFDNFWGFFRRTTMLTSKSMTEGN